MIFYRILISLAYVAALVRCALARPAAGPVAERCERLVLPPPRAGDAPLIWVHGASNGELTAARPLIAALIRRVPEAELLVTTNSRTGRALAAGWSLPAPPCGLPRSTSAD
ncbi:MAG: glycosyltransferase N-terminal domain-containing protein [Paracoccaceae bacterium]